uniref:Uncharacterized protein n=1 Tax=Oryza meridionalis TaxID=40149 RepID=A0A0E0EBP9_9ORYZ
MASTPHRHPSPMARPWERHRPQRRRTPPSMAEMARKAHRRPAPMARPGERHRPQPSLASLIAILPIR